MSKQSGQVSLAKDYLRGATKQLEKARAAGVDLSALVPLLTALIELAAEVLPGVLKRKDGLEEAIEKAAKELPEGWTITLEVGKGSAVVDLYHWSDDEYVHVTGDGSPAEEIARCVKIAQAATSASVPRG